jgi:hypothetical protein
MALTQDEIAQIQQLLDSEQDVTEEQLVRVLNSDQDDEFVRQSSLTEDEIPFSSSSTRRISLRTEGRL